MPKNRSYESRDRPSPEARAIGERVRKLREAAGFSATELGKRLDLSVAAVNEIQQGRSVKQYIQFAAVAKALNTTPNALLGVTEADVGSNEHLLAAVEGVLLEAGWSAQDVSAALDIARKASTTPPLAGLSRAQSAQAAAALEWRRRKEKAT